MARNVARRRHTLGGGAGGGGGVAVHIAAHGQRVGRKAGVVLSVLLLVSVSISILSVHHSVRIAVAADAVTTENKVRAQRVQSVSTPTSRGIGRRPRVTLTVTSMTVTLTVIKPISLRVVGMVRGGGVWHRLQGGGYARSRKWRRVSGVRVTVGVTAVRLIIRPARLP